MNWTWTDWGDCGFARAGELSLVVTWDADGACVTWRIGAVELGEAEWGEA